MDKNAGSEDNDGDHACLLGTWKYTAQAAAGMAIRHHAKHERHHPKLWQDTENHRTITGGSQGRFGTLFVPLCSVPLLQETGVLD